MLYKIKSWIHCSSKTSTTRLNSSTGVEKKLLQKEKTTQQSWSGTDGRTRLLPLSLGSVSRLSSSWCFCVERKRPRWAPGWRRWTAHQWYRRLSAASWKESSKNCWSSRTYSNEVQLGSTYSTDKDPHLNVCSCQCCCLRSRCNKSELKTWFCSLLC